MTSLKVSEVRGMPVILTITPTSQLKGMSTPFRDMFKVICHKCGRVGHICSHCPTQDSDAANIAIANDKEAQAFTAIADDIEEAW